MPDGNAEFLVRTRPGRDHPPSTTRFTTPTSPRTINRSKTPDSTYSTRSPGLGGRSDPLPPGDGLHFHALVVSEDRSSASPIDVTGSGTTPIPGCRASRGRTPVRCGRVQMSPRSDRAGPTPIEIARPVGSGVARHRSSIAKAGLGLIVTATIVVAAVVLTWRWVNTTASEIGAGVGDAVAPLETLRLTSELAVRADEDGTIHLLLATCQPETIRTISLGDGPETFWSAAGTSSSDLTDIAVGLPIAGLRGSDPKPIPPDRVVHAAVITDTRTAGLGWSASFQPSDLRDGLVHLGNERLTTTAYAERIGCDALSGAGH